MGAKKKKDAVLQVKMESKLKEKAEEMAKEKGYSSFQEVVRVFTHSFIYDELSPLPEPQPSAEKIAEWDKEIEEAKKLVKQGKLKVYDDVDNALKHLDKL